MTGSVTLPVKPWRIITVLLLLRLGADAFAITCEPKNASTGFFGVSVSRARYYNAQVGRFWTMDSFEGNNQDPLTLHKYLYCHANPVNGWDPTGHSMFMDVMSSMAARMRVAASYVGSVASRAAPYLKNYFSSTKMAQRAAIGAGAALAMNNYVDFYIQPTVDELVLLSNEMIPLPNSPDGRSPSEEVMKVAVLGAELNEQIAGGNVSAPLRAQLPPYNWARMGIKGYEAISFLTHAQDLTSKLDQSFGLKIDFDPNVTQVAWFALIRGLDPDGDVRTFREAVAAYNQKVWVTLASKAAELEKRLQVYGTVKVEVHRPNPTGQ